ncbi:PNPLA domain-containing protein [Phytobacter diazotrophicus]
MSFRHKKIAMCLSGGGTRAMAFHAGVLKCLAESGGFENIDKISTVSGGSLLVGLIFKLNNYRWPTSSEYNNKLYYQVREYLCENSLMWQSIKQLKKPLNFRYILSRANLVSLALQSDWGISATMSQLPAVPEWSINGTTAENGKRFRFKRDNIGDYVTGYASAKKFLLADAMSVSAAFPGGIGPFSLNTKEYSWEKRRWGEDEGSAQEVFIDAKKLRIYDGGVYDNLGLEPFFDQSKASAKEDVDFIICSDASAPLKSGFTYWELNPWRLKRIMDITSEQSRALRIRTFIGYLIRNRGAGYLININENTYQDSLPDGTKVAHYPTSLKKFKMADFDAIAKMGYRIFQDKIKLF